MIHWRCRQDFGEDPFRLNLTVYDKDVLQVILLEMNPFMMN